MILTNALIRTGGSEASGPPEAYIAFDNNPACLFETVIINYNSVGVKPMVTTVTVSDPNGKVVFNSDKTGNNSDSFIVELEGEYTGTITSTNILGDVTDTTTLIVGEGVVPTISISNSVKDTVFYQQMFSPGAGMDTDTEFTWSIYHRGDLSYAYRRYTFDYTVEILDPDGGVVYSHSEDNVTDNVNDKKMNGSFTHTTDILGDYTVNVTATNMIGTSTETHTVSCVTIPSIEGEVINACTGFAWYPEPEYNVSISDRKASEWGWWFELDDPDKDHPAPSMPGYIQIGLSSKYAENIQFEWINPEGVVLYTKNWNKGSLNFSERVSMSSLDQFPKTRGECAARLTLSNQFETKVINTYIPCFNDLYDKENTPSINFHPHGAMEHDNVDLIWDAKGGTDIAVEWKDPDGTVLGTSSKNTASEDILNLIEGGYTATIVAKKGGHFREDTAFLHSSPYEEPKPSIYFTPTSPVVGGKIKLHWNSMSSPNLPPRTASVEWTDPDGTVLGTYTDLEGEAQFDVDKEGRYNAQIDVTTPEGLVVSSATSVRAVPMFFVVPKFHILHKGTPNRYTQLNGTGYTENGIIYEVDIESNGCDIAINKEVYWKYETIDTKFEMSVDGGPWTNMSLGGPEDSAYADKHTSYINYVGKVPWGYPCNVKIKMFFGPSIDKSWDGVFQPPATSGNSTQYFPKNQDYDPLYMEGNKWAYDYNQHHTGPHPSPSGYSFRSDSIRLTIGGQKTGGSQGRSDPLYPMAASRGWNCSGKAIMDRPMNFYNSCPAFTDRFASSGSITKYMRVEPDWPHTGWGSEKHSRLTTFTVPSGVTTMYANCVGSGGRYSNVVGAPFSPPGGGAYASGSFSVTPGEVITLQVKYTGGNDGYSAVKRADGTVLVKAVQGQNGTRTLGGHVCKGGQASACVGSVKHSGGDGGKTGGPWAFTGLSNGYNIGGCGGAAGPGGKGGNGGNGHYGGSANSSQARGGSGTGGSASGGNSSGIASDPGVIPGHNYGHIQEGGAVGILGKRESGQAYLAPAGKQAWTSANHGSTSFLCEYFSVDGAAKNARYPEGYFGRGGWHGDNGGVYVWY